MAKRGRPSKYKPEYCDLVYEHMEKGLSFESFAYLAKTCKDTIYGWLEKHEDFSDAVARGKSACLYKWETIGLAGTLGKIKGFSHITWAFNMKNRFQWQDRTEVETHSTQTHVIVTDQGEEEFEI